MERIQGIMPRRVRTYQDRQGRTQALEEHHEGAGLCQCDQLSLEGMVMIIHNVEQRSPEWFALRRGIITASKVGKFLLLDKKDQKSLDARQNLIDAKLGELADGDDTEPSYESYWMKRGTLLEPESIEAYEK